MARTYRRDKNGRFASSGGGGRKTTTGKAKGKKPAAKGRPVMEPPALPPSPTRADYRKTAAGMKAKAAAAKKGPANRVAASPRRFNAAERAYAEIKQSSKFRSDAKVRAEMQRRGFLKGKDAQGQLIGIARSARIKAGVEGKPSTPAATRAALAKRAGIAPSKRKRRR